MSEGPRRGNIVDTTHAEESLRAAASYHTTPNATPQHRDARLKITIPG